MSSHNVGIINNTQLIINKLGNWITEILDPLRSHSSDRADMYPRHLTSEWEWLYPPNTITAKGNGRSLCRDLCAEEWKQQVLEWEREGHGESQEGHAHACAILWSRKRLVPKYPCSIHLAAFSSSSGLSSLFSSPFFVFGLHSFSEHPGPCRYGLCSTTRSPSLPDLKHRSWKGTDVSGQYTLYENYKCSSDKWNRGASGKSRSHPHWGIQQERGLAWWQGLAILLTKLNHHLG